MKTFKNKNIIISSIGINIKQFRKRGMKITTDIGLTVQYNGVFNVWIKVKKSYKGVLSGLCGNFNPGKRYHELKTSLKKLLGQSEKKMRNSWKIDDSCPDVLTPRSLEEHPCKNASKRVQEAKEECSVLKEEPFSKCNEILDPNSGPIEDCEHDVCACEDNPEACFCESLATYQEICAESGIETKWQHLKRFSKCGKLNILK
jgi:hypothetical protein